MTHELVNLELTKMIITIMGKIVLVEVHMKKMETIMIQLLKITK